MKSQHLEIIEEKEVASCKTLISQRFQLSVIADQSFVSSKIESCNFENTVFSNCHFFACDFNKIEFSNCIFENCTFEFSHLRNSYLNNCNFENCTWKSSSVLECLIQDSVTPKAFNEICENGNSQILSTHDKTIYFDFMNFVKAS